MQKKKIWWCNTSVPYLVSFQFSQSQVATKLAITSNLQKKKRKKNLPNGAKDYGVGCQSLAPQDSNEVSVRGVCELL